MVSCVQTEVEEFLDETIRIDNFPQQLQVGHTFQLQASVFNKVGQKSSSNIEWTSTNPDVLIVDENGVATGLMDGAADVIAMADGISDRIGIVVTIDEVVETFEERVGELKGRGGYNISGQIRIYEENGDLFLEITNPKISGPGPFYYLSNQTNSVSGGVQVDENKAVTTSDVVTYELPKTVNLNTYDYLIVWCMPFSVTLGYGEFE